MKFGKVGVVGAGQMGAGIAQVFAQAGVAVLVTDARPQALGGAKAGIEGSLGRMVKKGLMPEADAKAASARIATVPGLSDLAGCDLVVEAVVEDLKVKVEVFKALDAVLAPAAILATNTSSISITLLAAATKRPDRFRSAAPRRGGPPGRRRREGGPGRAERGREDDAPADRGR